MAIRKKNGIHRISKSDEEIIYSIIIKRLSISPNDTEITKKDKIKRQADFDAYKEKITPRGRKKAGTSDPRRLCYEDLDEIISITDISYLELLQALSRDPKNNCIPVTWPSETEASMCSCCDIMTSTQRKNILALVRRVLSPRFEADDDRKDSPISRLYRENSIRIYSLHAMKKQVTNYEINDIYRRRLLAYNYNAVELSKIIYVCNSFDVSPHWLLALGDSQTILASNGETEMIMELFCFLPDERKEIILEAAELLVTEGGSL